MSREEMGPEKRRRSRVPPAQRIREQQQADSEKAMEEGDYMAA